MICLKTQICLITVGRHPQPQKSRNEQEKEEASRAEATVSVHTENSQWWRGQGSPWHSHWSILQLAGARLSPETIGPTRSPSLGELLKARATDGPFLGERTAWL